jgi:hypothetical protein
MQIDIRGPCSEGNEVLRRDIEQRVSSALAQFAPYIIHVTIRLEDAGHLRPGGGSHCGITVAVHGSGHVSADVLDLRVTTAIARALDHIAQALTRDLGYPSAPAGTLGVVRGLSSLCA